MMNIYSDLPATEDSLNREKYANEIAKGLLAYSQKQKDSIVFGLSGKWGSGKSTFLNLIKNQFESLCQNENIEPIFFIFNPWVFSGQEELQRYFLEELKIAIVPFARVDDLFSKAKEKALNLLNKLHVVKYVHSGLGELAKDITSTLESSKTEIPLIRLKGKIDRLLEKSNYKIIALIDDLDRLTPSEVAEVLKLVKMNANFKNMHYILAYDKEVLNATLKDLYGAHSVGYLEKIVQIDYELPEMLFEELEDIFFERVNNLISNFSIPLNTKELFDIWHHQELKFYFKTIRDLNRYLNAISFRLPSIHEEIDVLDFLIVEAIRIFDYESYRKMYHAYTGIFWSYAGSQVHWVALKDGQLEFINSTTKKLNEYLSKDWQTKRTRENRLVNPIHFEKYFALKLPKADISKLELKIFFEDSSKRNLIWQSLHSSNRLNAFFRRLNSTEIGSLNIYDKGSEIFRDMMSYWDKEENESDIHHYYMNLLSSMINIAQTCYDSIVGAKLLYNELLKDYNRFSFSRFLIISDILRNFKDVFDGSQDIIKNHFISNKDNLQSFLNKMLGDWNHYYLTEIGECKSSYICQTFMIHFAEFDKIRYNEYLVENFKNDKSLITIIKFMTFIEDKNLKPHRIYHETYQKLIPEDLRESFLDKIQNINLLQLSTLEISYRDFMISNLLGK